MGQIVQVQCAQCGFQKDIFTGGGLKDCELETISSALPEDGPQTLAEAVRRGASRFSISRKLSTCGSCGTIFALPVVEFTLNDTRMELRGACPQCGGAEGVEWVKGQALRCPDCGADMLPRQTGHWD